jgi:transglutaminase-like putative cysteine protease
MMRYRVVHKTTFRYDQPALASYNEARMLPARNENQIVFSSKVEVKPNGANFEFQDYFDTRVVFFEALEPHAKLSIISDSLVEIRTEPRESNSVSWDELKAAASHSLELVDYLRQTSRTTPPADLAKFATQQLELAGPHEAAVALCEKVYKTVKYQPGITGVHSVASEAWKKKQGVCQDFAHLVVGALRHIGIPARYVSGYLHPEIAPRLHTTVLGESHAWVEWFAGTWHSFDPTNNVPINGRHILVGRGRDYDDVPPLRGVFAGAESSELSVAVELTREL